MQKINTYLTIAIVSLSTSVMAENIYIDGEVQSRCNIQTDTAGRWGNSNAYTLSTAPADGGQVPIIRADVTIASAYYLQISTPVSFSSSPTLTDSTVFTGAIAVSQTSSSDMSGYQTASTTPQSNMRQYPLTIAGTTWFTATSTAVHGGGNNTPFPSGNYKGIVLAECIAM